MDIKQTDRAFAALTVNSVPSRTAANYKVDTFCGRCIGNYA